MDSVVEVFNSLSQREIDHITSSPTMKEAFLSDMSEDYGFSIEELELELSHLIVASPQIDKEVKLVVAEPVPVWNLGGNFKTQEKKAQLLADIKQSLQYEGKSKTQILKSLNKDNPSWRLVCDEVLEYMVAKKILIKLATKYHIYANQTLRETSFHRLIYQNLCESPKTTSALLKAIGYNNPKGRKKLIQALQIMVKERFVIVEGKQWKLAVEL